MVKPKTRDDRITQAARRYQRFTGYKADRVTTRNVKFPDVVLYIGECDGILYTTDRDGERQRYIHQFAKDSRPQLAVSHDGKFLVLLGRAFQFTERGIVDRKRSRR